MRVSGPARRSASRALTALSNRDARGRTRPAAIAPRLPFSPSWRSLPVLAQAPPVHPSSPPSNASSNSSILFLGPRRLCPRSVGDAKACTNIGHDLKCRGTATEEWRRDPFWMGAG